MAVRIHPITSTELDNHNERFTRYSAWSLSPDHEETDDNDEVPRQTELVDIPLSYRLIHYFEWLSTNNDHDIKLSYLKQLIKDGGDVLQQHEHNGFSVIHYTAAQWDVSITEFLVSRGAKIDCIDNEGATPLHLAAYSNHTDMIEFLLDNGGDPNCKTNIQQTPIHYAVRGDSIEALQLLVERGGLYRRCITADYRGRTPLQLAAELDRDKAVLFLLSIETSPACCSLLDKFGHPVLTTMILKMPQMAYLALDQFHKVYPAERRQEFRLQKVESPSHITKTPFEAVVENKEYNVLVHPVMRKLIEQKWRHFARSYLIIHFCIYMLFVLIWTTLYAYPSVQSKHQYNFPVDIWRIILWVIGIALLIEQIVIEVIEYSISHRRSKRFKMWLIAKLKDDIENCSHNSIFNEEKTFLENNLKATKSIKARYFKDPWNFLDCATFIALLVQVILHVFDIAFHSETLALWVASLTTDRVGALGVIMIWVRLLFYARATEFIGPMVAMIGQLSGNVAQYIIILSVIFIPYCVCFWVLFGGEQQTAANITELSPELTQPHRVAVMLFRMTLIDNFPYDTLRSIDELTNTILVISFLFLTAIISLNLFIALLSDTFQRVYDNAMANAEMQKAQLILSLQDSASKRAVRTFLKYIQENCAPLKEYYDDEEETQDSSLTKITHQIHKIVRDFSKNEDSRENQLIELKESVEMLQEQMSTINSQIEEIKDTLLTHFTKKASPTALRSVKAHCKTDNTFATKRPLVPLLHCQSRRDLVRKMSQRRGYITQRSNPAAAYQGHRKINKGNTATNDNISDDSDQETTPQ